MAGFLILSPDLGTNPVYPPWQFAGALRSVGHTVRLAGPAAGPAWPPLAEELRDAVRLPAPWAGLPRAREALSAAEGMDVCYAFKAMPTSLGVGLRVRAALGVPLLVHLDDWDAGYFAGASAARRIRYALRTLHTPRGDFWLRWSERRVAAADAVTVSTRALQRRYGGTVVRQGVDTRRWSPASVPRDEARRRLGLGSSDPMVLFLGTPRLHKGLETLARAPASLQSGLWFVGAGPDRLREAGVPEAVLDRATVRGPVPFAEAAWYLGAADVFVVPQSGGAYAEHQLPAKLLQAMALGCAIVTTDVGDASDLLGGDPPAGLVVPPDDPAALVAAITRVLEEPETALGLRREARRRAESDYGWDGMLRALTPVLQRVGVHV